MPERGDIQVHITHLPTQVYDILAKAGSGIGGRSVAGRCAEALRLYARLLSLPQVGRTARATKRLRAQQVEMILKVGLAEFVRCKDSPTGRVVGIALEKIGRGDAVSIAKQEAPKEVVG